MMYIIDELGYMFADIYLESRRNSALFFYKALYSNN